jgi:hypothetical protein
MDNNYACHETRAAVCVGHFIQTPQRCPDQRLSIPNSLIRLSNAVDTSFGAREVGADGPCRA